MKKQRGNQMWTPKRIRDLRTRFGEGQVEFCKRLRVSVDALRFWEQGRGKPSGPVEELLDRIEADLCEGRVKQPA